jgi:hypothetical protein
MTARPLQCRAKRPAGTWAALLLLFWVGEAKAADAVIATLACDPLEQGAALRLAPADDTPVYDAVGRRIREAAERAGHPIRGNAGLELYYSAVESIVEVRSKGPTFGSFDVRTVNREARVQLLFNVWSSSKDSIIGGRKTKDGTFISNHLIVSLELNREDNGRCVWRGEGAVALEGVTPDQVAAPLAATVAARLGKTVDKEIVRLP